MRLNPEALLAPDGKMKPAEPWDTVCHGLAKGHLRNQGSLRPRLGKESGQEPAGSHALPDSFTALTQSCKVARAMTSRASLAWHVTVVGGLHALEPRARRSPVSYRGRCGYSPGLSRGALGSPWTYSSPLRTSWTPSYMGARLKHKCP